MCRKGGWRPVTGSPPCVCRLCPKRGSRRVCAAAEGLRALEAPVGLPCQRPDSATSLLHPGVPLHSVTGSRRSLPQPGGDAGGRPGTIRHSALRKRWVPTQSSRTQPGIAQSEPDLPFVGLTEPVLWLRLGHTFPRVTCTAVAGRGAEGEAWGRLSVGFVCLLRTLPVFSIIFPVWSWPVRFFNRPVCEGMWNKFLLHLSIPES